MGQRILLVEDQAAMQMLIKSAIGHLAVLDICDCIADAHRELLKNEYALVISNDYLPDGCGLSFFSALKNQKLFQNLPLLFLVGERGRAQAENFPIGDYISKPIEIASFSEQIDFLLKKKSAEPLKIAPFYLDLNGQRASFTDENGKLQLLALTPIEFKLLRYFLLSGEEQTLSREQLSKNIWESSEPVSSHTLDTHISSLRKKIASSGKTIRSIIKKGYCLSSE